MDEHLFIKPSIRGFPEDYLITLRTSFQVIRQPFETNAPIQPLPPSPVGTVENSPAIYRWVAGPGRGLAPLGAKEINPFHADWVSAVPAGLQPGALPAQC